MENDQAIAQPRVSVIMPVYNREATIHAALMSALQQDYSNMEFIIINDGSQDDTQKIIETLQQQDPRIVLVNNSSNF
jgi:glycosyltransferase involved in cell wall biosynthesis